MNIKIYAQQLISHGGKNQFSFFIWQIFQFFHGKYSSMGLGNGVRFMPKYYDVTDLVFSIATEKNT